MVLRNEIAFFGVIVVFALAVSLFAVSLGVYNPLTLAIRLLALNGFIAVAIAAIMTPFLKEITLFLKKSFIDVHHYFAAAGLVLLTLHPTLVAIQALNPAILLPNVSSLYSFFLYGGSIALITLYTAFSAVALRRKIVAYWRPLHMLMYVALFFGVIHANLLGVDLQNTAFKVIYDTLFAAVLAAFVLKRWQFHQLRVNMKKYASRRNANTNPAAHS